MIIQLEQRIDEGGLGTIRAALEGLNIPSYQVKTQEGIYMVCTPKGEFDIRRVGHLEGIRDVHRVRGDHKMVSSEWKLGPSTVQVDDETIGGGDLAIMAGPCSIEDEFQVEAVVDQLLKHNVKFMRGGVFKPRTSPYSFRGLGMEGLKMFSSHCKPNGIKIVTEVMEAGQIELMYPYVDVFQVGARNSQNFNLLDALGEIDKPVLLKRGISGSIDELLYSAEYVFKSGNEKIVLCERGIRSFEKSYRNTLDLNAVPVLKEKSHLPVIVDPSHGIGLRKHVTAMSLASVAAGADGLIVEMHPQPEIAATDAKQTINFTEFADLIQRVRTLKEAVS